jgi:hypothetical protein
MTEAIATLASRAAHASHVRAQRAQYRQISASKSPGYRHGQVSLVRMTNPSGHVHL